MRNIDPNPDNRLNLVETLHTFNTFLYQKNINNITTFEQLTDSFIENKIEIDKEVTIDKKKGLYQTKSMRIKRKKSKA